MVVTAWPRAREDCSWLCVSCKSARACGDAPHARGGASARTRRGPRSAAGGLAVPDAMAASGGLGASGLGSGMSSAHASVWSIIAAWCGPWGSLPLVSSEGDDVEHAPLDARRFVAGALSRFDRTGAEQCVRWRPYLSRTGALTAGEVRFRMSWMAWARSSSNASMSAGSVADRPGPRPPGRARAASGARSTRRGSARRGRDEVGRLPAVLGPGLCCLGRTRRRRRRRRCARGWPTRWPDSEPDPPHARGRRRGQGALPAVSHVGP